MKRRAFLGLCGAGGAGVALAAIGARRARATGPTLRSPKRAILVFATGGWDTTYALDPKTPDLFDVPAGAMQRFGGLDVFVDASRPSVTDFFTRHGDVAAIARGICTDAINHNECQRRIATGTREETRPDFGAIVAHDLGNDLPIPYLVLGQVAYTGPYAVSAARVGTTNQIVELLDGGAPDPRRPRAVWRDQPDDAELAMLRDYARASADRARATRGAIGYNRKRVDDFVEAIDRGDRLRALGGEFGARGETVAFARQIALALDALEQDVSHAAMLTTNEPWDTHSDNEQQGAFHELTFNGLAMLVDELQARPGRAAGTKMIDDTVVVVFSELSRTPRLNGNQGKDHWPITSALVIGAGVRGGATYGATTPDGLAMTIDMSTGAPDPNGARVLYAHFVAGVLALCGVDPQQYFPGTRPFDAFAV
jgi:uncharacterized protein (DUF1501 family)